MDQAREEMDPSRRLAIYHRLHRIFRDDAPAIFVVNSSQKYAFRRRVRGPDDLASRPLRDLARTARRGGRLRDDAASPMIRYVARRLLLAVPTLFGIVVLVFLLLHLAPGHSGLGRAPSRAAGSAAGPPRRCAGSTASIGRFRSSSRAWLGRVVRLDLGESFVDHRPVAERIREALPVHARPERAGPASDARDRDSARSRGGSAPRGRASTGPRRRALRPLFAADLLGGAAAPDALLGPAPLAAALRRRLGFGARRAGRASPTGSPISPFPSPV